MQECDPGQNQLMVTEIQALTDQCPMTHSPCIVNCLPQACLFQSLSIKELTLDCVFKVMNALVIDHRWLWGLDIPLKFPFGIVGRFRRLRGEKQWEGGSGGHVKCLGHHSCRMLILDLRQFCALYIDV